MPVDYHCHTHFSADCDVPMSDQCRAAILGGVKQIAFTEHEDYNPTDLTSFFFKHEDYMREVTRCREQFGDQLTIRAGIEISEPHRHAECVGEVLRKHNWDFVLGSLHWLTPMIDSCKDAFFVYSNDWRQSFCDYFTEMVELARDGDFDVLSHLDYPSRYNRHRFGESYDIRDYEDIIREVLKQIIARNKGIEINTSPWRKGLRDPNPPQAVLNWYREMGGEILTLGSDSHATKDVGADIPQAMQMARDAGFTHIAVYEGRKPSFTLIQALIIGQES